ncbi:MAG: pilus assembly protein TadE [Candidatus Wallbacteria bacterium HGW-Wallbacteria-1]|jgi:Flp pilus assembly protein TadG|uniref:Pilus assembly protein TadE n=1 Tax=Candidatus Wallbacteria bacterium HGW-Wallbacteria-1 TaxID=2013854 RepID=A0A2N1PIH3_9BACT|nr:MAG: pilus assembly protein TadE [Candidatus Wallbacteria bacterium HGW-Wallbacteria-1]
MMAFKKSGRGQALVEFALVLPLLLVLFFAIIEFGYLFYHQYCLADGVRAGARAGSIGRDLADIRNEVIARSTLPISINDISISKPANSLKGSPFRVSASFNHRLLTPLLGKQSIVLSFNTSSPMEY